MKPKIRIQLTLGERRENSTKKTCSHDCTHDHVPPSCPLLSDLNLSSSRNSLLAFTIHSHIRRVNPDISGESTQTDHASGSGTGLLVH